MKKRTVLFLLAVILLLSLCACGKQNTQSTPATAAPAEAPASEEAAASQPEEIILTDMIGREVSIIPGSYKRVVCIGAGALRMFSYVGDVSLLCGVEDIDNLTLAERPKMFDAVARPYVLAYGDVFAALPSCGVGGPNAQTAEAEKILSCDPDIVISEYEDVEKEDALQEQLGVPVITLRSGPDGVWGEEFSGSMELLGKVFDEEKKAELLIGFVEGQAEELRARTAGIPEGDRPGVYICGLGNWGTTNHLMTSQNYKPFEITNIKNVVTSIGKNGIQPLEEEKFVSIGEDMDVMIIDAAAVKNIKPLFDEDPALFDSCRAWQNGEVYLQMAYNAYYTNYETALINTWYAAKTVYPDAFDDIDMTEITNKITQAFYSMDMAEKIFTCPASFGGYQKIDTETFFK